MRPAPDRPPEKLETGIWQNHLVDVAVAVGGWLLVVFVVMGAAVLDAPFPLLHSVGSR